MIYIIRKSQTVAFVVPTLMAGRTEVKLAAKNKENFLLSKTPKPALSPTQSAIRYLWERFSSD